MSEAVQVAAVIIVAVAIYSVIVLAAARTMKRRRLEDEVRYVQQFPQSHVTPTGPPPFDQDADE